MPSDTNWQDFFDRHASAYLENVFTHNTAAEVAFLLDAFQVPVGSRLLDVGCGTGRHAVLLALQGYQVTGIDLSSGMLAEAEKAARAAGAQLELIQVDAADYTAPAPFDAAYCLCEGAFCLLGQQDDPLERDFRILCRLQAALKPGAPFVLTALNAFRRIRQVDREIGRDVFDPITSVETTVVTVDTAEGPQAFPTRERQYTPAELSFMLRQAGFTVEHIYGGTAGNWGRRPLEMDEIELMVIARRR